MQPARSFLRRICFSSFGDLLFLNIAIIWWSLWLMQKTIAAMDVCLFVLYSRVCRQADTKQTQDDNVFYLNTIHAQLLEEKNTLPRRLFHKSYLNDIPTRKCFLHLLGHNA